MTTYFVDSEYTISKNINNVRNLTINRANLESNVTKIVYRVNQISLARKSLRHSHDSFDCWLGLQGSKCSFAKW